MLGKFCCCVCALQAAGRSSSSSSSGSACCLLYTMYGGPSVGLWVYTLPVLASLPPCQQSPNSTTHTPAHLAVPWSALQREAGFLTSCTWESDCEQEWPASELVLRIIVEGHSNLVGPPTPTARNSKTGISKKKKSQNKWWFWAFESEVRARQWTGNVWSVFQSW